MVLGPVRAESAEQRLVSDPLRARRSNRPSDGGLIQVPNERVDASRRYARAGTPPPATALYGAAFSLLTLAGAVASILALWLRLAKE
jgi:hypothetical protein